MKKLELIMISLSLVLGASIYVTFPTDIVEPASTPIGLRCYDGIAVYITKEHKVYYLLGTNEKILTCKTT